VGAQVLEERMRTLTELHGKVVGMYSVLGLELESAFAELGAQATTTRIQSLRQKLRETEAEYGRREDAFLGLQARARSLWGELEVEGGSRTELDVLVDGGAVRAGLSTSSLERVGARVRELEAERERRAREVETMGTEISALWVKLGTSAEEQTSFLESRRGLGEGTLRVCGEYLRGLREEFARRVGDLLGEARGRVRELWGVLRRDAASGAAACPEAAEEWVPPAEPSEQEECFNRVREHALQLEREVEEVSALLQLISKREAILADKDEYSRIISDPSRLLSRGGGAARLREEKLERRIKKELPQVCAKLAKACQDYEHAHGAPFCVDGARVLDTLKAEEEEEKEMKRKAVEDRKRSNALPGTGIGASSSSSSSSSSSFTATGPVPPPLVPSAGAAVAKKDLAATSSSTTTTTSRSASRPLARPDAPKAAAAPKAPLARAKAAENKAPAAKDAKAPAAAAAAAAPASGLLISDKARADAAATLHAIEAVDTE
jgi:Microtubule associated protein (MAP65/ASE1 family)